MSPRSFRNTIASAIGAIGFTILFVGMLSFPILIPLFERTGETGFPSLLPLIVSIAGLIGCLGILWANAQHNDLDERTGKEH